MKRILELEEAMEATMELAAPGCFVEHYSSTECGDEEIMGRHATVYVPRTGPLHNGIKAALVRIFERYYADPIKVGVNETCKVGGGDTVFTTFTIEY